MLVELDKLAELDVVLSEVYVLSVIAELSGIDCSDEVEKLSDDLESVDESADETSVEMMSGILIPLSESETSLAAHPVNIANAAIIAICFIVLFILKSFPREYNPA